MHVEVADLERSIEFYSRLLPHARISRWNNGTVAAVVMPDGTAFGLWLKGTHGMFNGRGGQHLHFAFQVTDQEYEDRKAILDEMGLELFEHIWPKGGRSIYFFDPDGHQGEFMTVDWFGI
jgi:catechol 2,3-dioxygenase-like lactoylglutathione lyase family enzyme